MSGVGEGPDRSLAGSVTVDDVRRAAARLRGVANRTPVLTSRSLDARLGAGALVKCESFQRVGAFKFRGAYNALSRLSDASRGRGVLTYSSGNHAQAVALAASLTGTPATIVMPTNAPTVKLAATRAYLGGAPEGSGVVTYDPATQSREALGSSIAEERGLTVIPPYDHPDVIAGQGTVALEMFGEATERRSDGATEGGEHARGTALDWLFVPCGGGGLLSGCAVVARALSPGCRVVGVEPALADDATRSLRTGVLHAVSNPPTIADGARTPFMGRHTFAIASACVDEMMTVEEAEIAGAMAWLMSRMKLVVEPTGALAAAGAFARAGRFAPGARVGIVVSGGNVDPADLGRLLAIAGA